MKATTLDISEKITSAVTLLEASFEMNQMMSSGRQISDTTQDYTGNVSEKIVQNRTVTASKSTVHYNTVRASGRIGQNSSLRVTDDLKERTSQNSTPIAPVTESMSQSYGERITTEDSYNAPKDDKAVPSTSNVEKLTNSIELTTEVVPTTQQDFNLSAIFNTTNSTSESTSASARIKVFWLSKMTSTKSTAGTTTTVQWDISTDSSDSDGMAT